MTDFDGGTRDGFNRDTAVNDASDASGNLYQGTAEEAISGRQVMMADADGIVVLPDGVSLDDISVEGRDLVVTLADGSVLVIPDGAIIVPQLVVEGVAVAPDALAALLNDAELDPEAEPEDGIPSSGGNFAGDEGVIQDAFDRGDLLPFTELSRATEEEEEFFPFEDSEPEVVIETPDNPIGVVNAASSVNEAGLPERGTEPEGTDEPSDSEATTGTIVITSPDGIGSVLINGEEVTGPGQEIVTDLGVLTITSVDLDTGEIGYEYRLGDNTSGDGVTDPFEVTVTDTDGDEATATLVITIIDDAPIAADDTNTVPAGEFGPVEGNVLDNDVPGADDYAPDGAITGFSNDGGSAVPGESLQGEYGLLTLNPDGTYTYVRNPDTPGGVQDVFTYEIIDSDGSTSTATLTIDIADSPVTITLVPAVGTPGTVVEEGGLGTRGDEPEGSDEGADGDPDNDSVQTEGTGGTITFEAPDGLGEITIGGVTVVVGTDPQVIIDDDTGTLVVTEVTFDPDTGEGTITYEYELGDNTDGDDVTVEVDLVITDTDGDEASDTLVITVIDDVPEAVIDTNELDAGEFGPVSGNVLDNDTQGADGAEVTGFSGAGGSAGAGGTVEGMYGVLTINPDGTYTYTRNPDTPGGVEDVFEYTISDGDGDTSTAPLIITIADAPVVLTLPVAGEAGTIVDEAGLDGSPAGSEAGGDGELTTGTITFEAGDGVSGVFIDGVEVTGVGQTFTGDSGTLTITGIADGEITYEYELTSPTSGDDTSDDFLVRVVDNDNDFAEGTLEIAIIDDEPAANPDTDTVTEDGPTVATGNVLTGTDTTTPDVNDTDGVADVTGADGANVTGVAAGDTGSDVDGNVGSAVAGTYGSITVGADGDYSYELDNDDPAVQALAEGETLTETFTYTITDGDGDTATTTVAITINGTNDAPTAVAGVAAVSDEGLRFANPDDDGDPQDTTNSATVLDGDLQIADADNNTTLTVSLGIPTETISVIDGSDTGAPLTWQVSDDGLTLIGFTDDAGDPSIVVALAADGTYTVTLNDPVFHPDTTVEDVVGFTVPVTVSDGIADTATTISVSIEDDAPVLTAPIADETVTNNPDADPLVGSLNLSAGADGPAAGAEIMVDTTGLTIGGQPLVTVQEGNVLTAFVDADGDGVLGAGDTTAFTLTVDPTAGASGEYTFDLVTPLDGSGTNSATDINIPVSVTLADCDFDTVSDSFVITVANDAPDAVDDIVTAQNQALDINVAFVLDFSSSIDTDELDAQLTAVRDAAAELFASTSGDVSITLIGFDANSLNFGTFDTLADVEALIASINPADGGTRPLTRGTNYSAGIQELIDGWDPAAGDVNQLFFISDGRPTRSRGSNGEALNDTVRPLWDQYVADNDFDITAIGVGDGVNGSNLAQIDIDGEGSPLLIDDFDDLIDTIITEAIPSVSGNVLDNDVASSTGIAIVSIEIDGNLYTFDGSEVTLPGGATQAGSSITVTTAMGGEFTFDFANGEWNYVPSQNAPTGSEVFTYTVEDADGDTDSANLQIDLTAVSVVSNSGQNAPQNAALFIEPKLADEVIGDSDGMAPALAPAMNDNGIQPDRSNAGAQIAAAGFGLSLVNFAETAGLADNTSFTLASGVSTTAGMDAVAGDISGMPAPAQGLGDQLLDPRDGAFLDSFIADTVRGMDSDSSAFNASVAPKGMDAVPFELDNGMDVEMASVSSAPADSSLAVDGGAAMMEVLLGLTDGETVAADLADASGLAQEGSLPHVVAILEDVMAEGAVDAMLDNLAGDASGMAPSDAGTLVVSANSLAQAVDGGAFAFDTAQLTDLSAEAAVLAASAG